MSRPTHLTIDRQALIHNLNKIRQLAPSQKIIAMVKADAYGAGIGQVIPTLEGQVDAFGVACMEEAMAIRRLGSGTEIILFQGNFSAAELTQSLELGFTPVIHQVEQLQWLIDQKIDKKISVWVKINTGMNRLGFSPEQAKDVVSALRQCPFIQTLGLMTHLACADESQHPLNQHQLDAFSRLQQAFADEIQYFSAANSATLFNFPDARADVVRPGIMLYGISPFAGKPGVELGLKPVMSLKSKISALHDISAGETVGYGALWAASSDAKIALIPTGYGDGYPRVLDSSAAVWVNGREAPVVGRISMDMMTIDVSECPDVAIGDEVELWGSHMPIERIARAANTIAYELATGITQRPRKTTGIYP